jgi:ketosteroid isomerase-like protein
MATTDPLVAAERAFASAAASEGTRAAFLQFLSKDSILFRPDPVDGQAWFREQPANPGLLSWRPEFVEIAATGDLGYTTGPWSFRSELDSEPIEYGQYVSVWRRGRRSPWKVSIDVGVTSPPPVKENESTQVISIAHQESREGISESMLFKVEENLAEQVRKQGYLAAVHQLAAANVWILRMGQAPLRGLQDLSEELPDQPLGIEWKVYAAAVASSGDLGYVYGTGRRVISDLAEERCSFLRIWRWGNQERWELALDIDNPFQAGT